MARKISERERLITFVLNADDDALREAKELIDTALRNRAPKQRKTPKKRATHITDMMAERNPPSED